MPEPPISLSFSFESLPTWWGYEPDPCLRCTHNGCLWHAPIESDDWSDRSSSTWYRAEQHMAETGHTVQLFLDHDDPDPWEV